MHSERTAMDNTNIYRDFYKGIMAVPAGMSSTRKKVPLKAWWQTIREKDELCAAALTKIHLEPPAACKHLMLRERSTSCNQKRNMKENVWAAMWIVFFCCRENGLLRGYAHSSNRTPCLIFSLVISSGLQCAWGSGSLSWHRLSCFLLECLCSLWW